MKMRVVAFLAFFLNTFLFGTYYSISKDATNRIDPIIFCFFVMGSMVPIGLVMIWFSRKHLRMAEVKSGAILGCCLGLGLLILSVSLKYNTATGTAFFPALNGLLAAVFSWLFLRQPIQKMTWFAGSISVIGAVMLMANASMGGLRGATIAFIGGLLCTIYVFLADREQQNKQAYWGLFGVELLTMGILTGLVTLLFGDWQAVHPNLPEDGFVILYIALGTTFFPTLVTVFLQKHISPITVSFIYILEPILGAIFAFFYLHETLPLDGYLGGVLIIGGSLIYTWREARKPVSGQQQLLARLARSLHGLQTSLAGTVLFSLFCLGVGASVVIWLGGFPPASWLELHRIGPQMMVLLQDPQQQGATVMILAQSLSWLFAWTVLVVMSLMTIIRCGERIFARRTPARSTQSKINLLVSDSYHPTSILPAHRRLHGQKPVERRKRGRRESLTSYVEFAEVE